MESTKEKIPPPPAINGKPSQWANVALIERQTGMQSDEMNILSPTLSEPHEWLTYRAFIRQEDGTYLLDQGMPGMVYCTARLIESAVNRQTMRPDATIIDPFTQTWRQVGQ